MRTEAANSRTPTARYGDVVPIGTILPEVLRQYGLALPETMWELGSNARSGAPSSAPSAPCRPLVNEWDAPEKSRVDVPAASVTDDSGPCAWLRSA